MASSKRVRPAFILGPVAAAAVAAVVVWAVKTRPQAAVASPPEAAAPAAPPADAALPPASESDGVVRGALSGLSAHRLFQRFLEGDHLLDRLAVIAVNLAEDHTPRRELRFLRPSRGFSVAHSGGETVISPRAQARYDVFAGAVASVDPTRVAAAYRALHPLLESAYHALGYPGRPLDGVVTAALQRVVDAPVRERVVVRRSGSVWVFADQALESQGEVEKQFLRMGPRNTRSIQNEARELASALGLQLRGDLQAATAR